MLTSIIMKNQEPTILKKPEMRIFCDPIYKNTRLITEFAKNLGISVWGVTKGLCGSHEIARIFIEGGCAGIADSRLDNIIKQQEFGINAKFLLIRIPMPSEIADAVRITDSTLVSSIDTILMIEQECRMLKKNYDVILMIEVGDLREGLMEDALFETKDSIRQLERVRIIGVGANLSCFGGILPSFENISHLIKCKKIVEEITGYPLEKVSIGGTTCVPMLYDGFLHKEINHLRIGSAMLRGSIAWKPFDWLRQDTIEFYAEWVEVARKPSKPWGIVELDAFGKTPYFDDIGIRLRGILGAGRQDIFPEGLRSVSPGLKVLGASSDHLVCDIEEMANRPKVGELAAFRVNYAAMMTAATSPYVEKIYC